MKEKTYLANLASHFAVVALAASVCASIAKSCDDAPLWAFLAVLLLAPLTAYLIPTLGSLRRRFVLGRRDRRHFPAGTVAHLGRALKDLLDGIRSKRSGLIITEYDPGKIPNWIDQVLKTLRDALHKTDPLPADAYVIWLKADDGLERISATRACNAAGDYLSAHFRFEKGEGLAGKVWEAGIAASHSKRNPNPNWQSRPGCNNESYICVPVGKAGGLGGVLGLGSDAGFEASQAQIEIMEIFAAILALVAEARPRSANIPLAS